MINHADINPLRFLAGLGILAIALYAQSFLAAAGWHFNLVLAALIAFAFSFDFLEVLALDLLAIFSLNWQPAPSAALLIFAVIPLAIFFVSNSVRSEPWIGVIVATLLGFFVFYITLAPSQLLHHAALFFEDAILCLLFAETIIVALTP
jgi:hypothetical protein